MERFNKWKLSIGAIRCYYSTSPIFNTTRPLPLIRQPNPSISFQNLTRSCGFSSSSYFRQRFTQRGQVNQFYSGSKRFFSCLKRMRHVVLFCGFLYFLEVKKVPYSHRKRLSISSDHEARFRGDLWMHNMKVMYLKGKVLPGDDPRSLKASSILKKVLDTFYKDLELDEVPIITYYDGNLHEECIADTIFKWAVLKTNEEGITDKILQWITRKICSLWWRTDISHLKGRNWKFVVVDKPEGKAFCLGDEIIVVYTGLLDSYSDVEIATLLNHEVGHCVARHCAEATVVYTDYSDKEIATVLAHQLSVGHCVAQPYADVADPYDKLMSKLLNLTRPFEPIH